MEKPRSEKSGRSRISISATPVSKDTKKSDDDLRQQIQDIWLALEDLMSRTVNNEAYISDETEADDGEVVQPIVYEGIEAIDITENEVSLLIDNTGVGSTVTQSDLGVKVDVAIDDYTIEEEGDGTIAVHPENFLLLCDEDSS